MERVQLEVYGLSANPASQGTYALLLREVDGRRRLPIIIGAPEAMSISTELEGAPRPRPMTHDLIKNIIVALSATVTGVFIHELSDQTFYASIELDAAVAEIDSRPSDAIAVALRFNAPIYIAENLLEEAGFYPDDEDDESTAAMLPSDSLLPQSKTEAKPSSRLDVLHDYLEKAINNEEYEKAAQLRDEIERLKNFDQ